MYFKNNNHFNYKIDYSAGVTSFFSGSDLPLLMQDLLLPTRHCHQNATTYLYAMEDIKYCENLLCLTSFLQKFGIMTIKVSQEEEVNLPGRRASSSLNPKSSVNKESQWDTHFK